MDDLKALTLVLNECEHVLYCEKSIQPASELTEAVHRIKRMRHTLRTLQDRSAAARRDESQDWSDPAEGRQILGI